MSEFVSIRDLRNDASAVVRRVESGETLVVTVDRRPVATLAPLPRKRTYVPMAEILASLRTVSADPGLLDDLRQLLPETTDDLNLDR
jgi:prevent-host-death family protein